MSLSCVRLGQAGAGGSWGRADWVFGDNPRCNVTVTTTFHQSASQPRPIRAGRRPAANQRPGFSVGSWSRAHHKEAGERRAASLTSRLRVQLDPDRGHLFSYSANIYGQYIQVTKIHCNAMSKSKPIRNRSCQKLRKMALCNWARAILERVRVGTSE